MFQLMVTGAPGANGLALELAVCHAVMVLRNELEQELVITHPLLATGPHVLDQTRTVRVKTATILPAHVRIDIITLKAPPIICSRRKFQILPLFLKHNK